MAINQRIVRFINVAHALDHLVMLIFPTAVLGMGADFGTSYGELLALSLGGFIAFGAGSLPAGWLGDLWSRRNMLAVFFIGVGVATMLTALSSSRLMLAAALTLIGAFAAIYHPVGTAMLTAHAEGKLGRTIGVNGVWGNLGVAFAALVTGAITQWIGWRWAFVAPGVVAIGIGIAFLLMVPDERNIQKVVKRASAPLPRNVVIHAFAVLVLVTMAGSVVFNATTIAMPKVFDERLPLLAATPFRVGALVFLVYAIGAMAQLIVGHFVDRYPLRTVFLPLSLHPGALPAAGGLGAGMGDAGARDRHDVRHLRPGHHQRRHGGALHQPRMARPRLRLPLRRLLRGERLRRAPGGAPPRPHRRLRAHLHGAGGLRRPGLRRRAPLPASAGGIGSIAGAGAGGGVRRALNAA